MTPTSPHAPSAASRGRRPPDLGRLSDDALLDMRFCDLGVTIDGSPLLDRVRQLHQELEERNLRFRPHCWLSSEWFSPDGVPGIAIPFYLAHPRLIKLEQRLMLDVEGGTKTSSMQLLRHEAGHALEVAYQLRRRPAWRRVFGVASQPYPEQYKPIPFSRDYVLHLDWWYAQSHPLEDFAETFAVWLRPGSQWRRRYRGWPALRKLEYVDRLMAELTGKPQIVRSRALIEPLHRLRTTLREHYRERQERYGSDYPDVYSSDLRRLFAEDAADSTRSAAMFLRHTGPELRSLVATWTGQPPYTIDLLLKEMVSRCRQLKLRMHRPENDTKLELAILLTMQTMNFVYSDDHKLAL